MIKFVDFILVYMFTVMLFGFGDIYFYYFPSSTMAQNITNTFIVLLGFVILIRVYDKRGKEDGDNEHCDNCSDREKRGDREGQ